MVHSWIIQLVANILIDLKFNKILRRDGSLSVKEIQGISVASSSNANLFEQVMQVERYEAAGRL